jgi:hypothetical protein
MDGIYVSQNYAFGLMTGHVAHYSLFHLQLKWRQTFFLSAGAFVFEPRHEFFFFIFFCYLFYIDKFGLIYWVIVSLWTLS